MIGDVGISEVNILDVVRCIREMSDSNNPGYVCVCNSRSLYYAKKDKTYLAVQNGSAITVADGMPLVWIANNLGFKNVGKVSGKDLMDELFSVSVANNYSHYFYGSTPEVLDKMNFNLIRRYPGLDIVKSFSPPFQDVEEFDIDSLAYEINHQKPTFFWCGLGAPKQEVIISRLQPMLKSTICIGVGLAFEYYAETVKRAPLWMQDHGMEWMYRLVQQPKNIPRAIAPLLQIYKMYIFSFFFKKI